MESRPIAAETETPIMPEVAEEVEPVDLISCRRVRARNWLRNSLGVDKAIDFTVLGRGWSSFGGLVTVVLTVRFLTPAQQSYDTFGSLIALQTVFELGFSFVILQMASQEWAHLTVDPDGAISADPVAQDRLASVLQKTFHFAGRRGIRWPYPRHLRFSQIQENLACLKKIRY